MSASEDLEKVLSSTMDNLPPPFMIFGKKREHNPLEDFWMSKLESIENQYNEHIVKLERALLDNRVNKRRLMQKDEQLAKVKGDLKDKTTELHSLKQETTQLQTKLVQQDYKTTRLGVRLSKSEDIKSKVLKSLENERFERIKNERDLVSLKQRLGNLERDKKFLSHEVTIKDSERKRVEDREAQFAKSKFSLIRNLTDIDQKRRTQTEVNVKLVEDIGRLLHGFKTHDYRLLKQRKEIDLMIESMNSKQKENEEILRKLGITEKSRKDVQRENKYSKEKLEHLERQVGHWKEEFECRTNDNVSSELELKDLHRENSHLRCQLAGLRDKLNRTESRLKSLEIEKQRTTVELYKAKGQAKSVHMVMSRNELVKKKLAEKILKEHPSIQETLGRRHREKITTSKKRSSSENEIESYKKKIWELERQKHELEQSINESRSKRNRLQLKMKKYDGMEQQITWTEKAMVKLEGDRNRLQDLLKTMSLNVPNKLPFEKLVTDPSILDRVAKYQVLQKRLVKQSDMVENLKRNAVKIFEYRKLKMEDEQTDKRREIPQWKLSHWKCSSDDTLADVNDMFDPEGQPLSERKYYKDYLGYLDSEIPQLKKKISALERKQQYNLQQQQDAEVKTRNAEETVRWHKASVDEDGILADAVASSGGGDGGAMGAMAILQDDEGEEEQEYSDNGDVSIDEPPSALEDTQGAEHFDNRENLNSNGAEDGTSDDDENEIADDNLNSDSDDREIETIEPKQSEA